MQSLITTATSKDIIRDPFHYLYLNNAVSEDLATRLLNEFPAVETITKGASFRSNQRFSLSAPDVAKSEGITPLWKEFILRHLGPIFWREFINLFGEAIRWTYPDLWKGKDLNTLRLGVRGVDAFDKVDIVLDAQICVNTPVTDKASSVKISHIDNEHELFAGLWYLRKPEDQAKGGDLNIYRYKVRPRFHGPRLVSRHFVERTATVPYEHNSLVLFLNSLYAVHGVTPREVTSQPRLLVNILGEVEKPLFDLAGMKETFMDKVRRKLIHPAHK